MKAWRTPLLAAVPGLAVAVAALLGVVPSARDLPTYFVPLRQRTAEIIRGGHSAFFNPQVGCGEPYLANPQTGLFYPPAWLATVVDPWRAVGLEVGLHLAILATGCAALAAQLGAGPAVSVAAGWAVTLAGPSVSAAGVLNNLTALAWLPWLWWSVLRRGRRTTALFAALSFLAGEPQLAVVGLLVAVTLAPTRRTVVALVIGAGLTAAQAIPFVAWVAAGDRGPTHPASGAVAGHVKLARVPELVVPGAPSASGEGEGFLEQISLPAWVLILAGIAPWRRAGAARRLALWGWGVVVVSVLAGLPAGAEVWTRLSLGLLRYPSRLLFVAVVTLIPVAASCTAARRTSLWQGVAAASALLLVALLIGAAALPTALAALGAGLVLSSPFPAAGAMVGALALLPGAVDALHLTRGTSPPAVPCLEFQRGSGRVFVLEPSREQLAWARREPGWRPAALGWGYTPLLDGRRTVRSFAPVSSRRLAAHLAQADRGPEGQWWLDTLAASRVVAQHPVDALMPLCSWESYRVLDNPTAWPEAVVAASPPAVGRRWEAGGEILGEQGDDARRQWRVAVGNGGGVLLWLVTPDEGWRFEVDGRWVTAIVGPGIIQAVPVAPGNHTVNARYRPPGLWAGLAISSLAVLALLGVPWRRL